MDDEVVNGCPQRLLSEQDRPLQTGFLDGPNESLGVRIQTRRPRRLPHGLDTNIGKHVQELSREQRVSIMDQIALAMEHSVDRIANIPANLAHA